MNKIKWVKIRNEYAKKNTYITREAIDGTFYITSNDTPNGNWNLYETKEKFDLYIDNFNLQNKINHQVNNMETIEMFHTLAEVKATVQGYK